MQTLSILIPTYDCVCTKLVCALAAQPALGTLTHWEIIVADDGSPQAAVVEANRKINDIEGCRMIECEHNIGRAAIRNLLAQAAQYDYLLFIDADMTIADTHFIGRYIAAAAPVIYGGYKIEGHVPGNLRYMYERRCENAHHAAERSKHPYHDFHTSNYLIERELMLSHPLDTTYTGYGYEDVAYGETLRQAGIAIRHIDNPVIFSQFEPNEIYLAKTEESLHTLYQHRHQLAPYSRLISATHRLRALHLHGCYLRLYRLCARAMRQQLIRQPRLWLFSLYKIGYYLHLGQTQP